MKDVDESMLIPEAWLSQAKVKRIHLHWTAGPAMSRPDESMHYHFILNQDLTLRRGVYSIADQERPTAGRNNYAAHTLGANQMAIGYSLAGMRGAVQNPFDPGPDPITEAQWSRAVIHIAQLVKFYGITIGPKTVLTHAEVEDNLGIKQRAKWDIAILPWDKEKWHDAKTIGDLLRAEVLFKVQGN